MRRQYGIFIAGTVLVVALQFYYVLPEPTDSISKLTSGFKHFIKWSELKRLRNLNQSAIEKVGFAGNYSATKETPASDRVLLLPAITAAKVVGALYYINAMVKSPLFKLDFELPHVASDYGASDNYNSNSYAAPPNNYNSNSYGAPPSTYNSNSYGPPPDNYNSYAAPPRHPYYPKKHKYKKHKYAPPPPPSYAYQRPYESYSEEDQDDDDDCSSEEKPDSDECKDCS